MKKLLAALMTLCLTVSLSACSVSLDTGEEPSQGSSSVPADGEFSGTTIEIAERFTVKPRTSSLRSSGTLKPKLAAR